ncbi:unnamed protein product [Notodromas monacha]|uniref:Fanconi anemia group D2 protein n=1 Tax=Notodromas monacha TaxID=399045 RepID=A0A7R9BND5_9CRUS|nr:unnamed protein product [Notodromas monacha]CAG0918378.1 unnamed protein product [Notodromas monacha]
MSFNVGKSRSAMARSTKSKAFNLDADSDDDDLLASSQEAKSQMSFLSKTSVSAKSPYFAFLEGCGILLKSGKGKDVLTTYATNALMLLEDGLRKETSQYRQGFEKFVSDYFSHKDCLKLSLMLFEFHPGDPAMHDTSLGFARLLLTVSSIQSQIFHLLLDKAIKLGDESQKMRDGVNWIQLILARIGNIPELVNSDEICDKLLGLLGTQPVSTMKIIISHLAGILGEAQHERVAEKLMEIREREIELTPVILDALSNLCLDSETSQRLKSRLVSSVASANPAVLPELVFFLLDGLTAEEIKTMVPKIRDRLHIYQESAESTSTGDTHMSLLMYRLGSLLEDRNIARIWKSTMEKSNAWRSSDLVVLLILMRVDSWTCKLALNFAKNKITAGIFDVKAVDVVIDNAPEVLGVYMKQYLELARGLLQIGDPACVALGRHMHQKAFVGLKPRFRQDVMMSLTGLISSSATQSNGRPPPALEALAYLVRYHPNLVADHAHKLTNFLEWVNSRPVPQVRMMLDVYCTIACFSLPDGSPYSGTCQKMRSEMLMVIRKRLGRMSTKLEKVGVIAAAMLLKALANQRQQDTVAQVGSGLQDSGDTRDSEATEEIIKRDPGFEEISSLLHLTQRATERHPIALALLYDQFSDVLGSGVLASGATIQDYFYQRTYRQFSKDTYVEDQTNLQKFTASDSYDMRVLFELDDASTSVTPGDKIFLNIGGLLLQDAKSNPRPNVQRVMSDLYALLPKFRMLVACVTNRGKDLESIFSLLEIGILVPTIILGKSPATGVVNWDWDWESLDQIAQKNVLRTYFYVANWFIEIISAFAAEIRQDDPELLYLVLNRLRQLIYVRRFLSRVLAECVGVDFVPPPARFEVDHPKSLIIGGPPSGTSGTGAKRGRKRKAAVINEAEQSLVRGTQESCEPATPRTQLQETTSPEKAGYDASCKNLTQFNIYFRELGFPAFKIFQANLDLRLEFENCAHLEKIPEMPPGEMPCLGLEEAEYLLTDLSEKLDFVFGSTHKKHFGRPAAEDSLAAVLHSNLSLAKIKDVATMTCGILGFLAGYLKVLCQHFMEIISARDGIEDSMEMFSPKSRVVSRVMNLILRCCRAYFSWPAFNRPEEQKLLEESLRAICGSFHSDEVSNSQVPMLSLATIAFESMQALSEYAPDLETAVELLLFLETIANVSKVDRNVEEFPRSQALGTQQLRRSHAKVIPLERAEKLIECAELYLKRPWMEKFKPGDCVRVGQILTLYVAHLSRLDDIWVRMKFLDMLVSGSFGKALEKIDDDPDYRDARFPTLNNESPRNEKFVWVECAELYLKRPWMEKFKPGDCVRVGQILTLYVAHLSRLDDIWVRMKFLDMLVSGSFGKALEKIDDDPDYRDARFPTLNKQTLAVFHKAALIGVLAVAKDISFAIDIDTQVSPSKHVDSDDDWCRRSRDSEPMNQLRLWQKALDMLEVLCRKTLERYSNKTFFLQAVRFGGSFLTELSRSGFPVMQGLFSSHREEVLSLISSIQKNHTRFFQHVCSQTKKAKDVGIGKFIPTLRKSLETFLFRVKGMLVANNCAAAFIIGNLKHKDVHGHVLASQMDSEDEESCDEMVEEEPVEENEDEEPMEVGSDDEAGDD